MVDHEKEHAKTDDRKAREAAEDPLGTATKSGPVSNGMSWSGPVALVAAAIVVLLVFVLFL
jgi:hypothetical protein